MFVTEQPHLVRDMLEMVTKFQQEVIGQPIPPRPRAIRGKRKLYCDEHLGEELTEFITARTAKEQGDAILDLIYVALGRLVELGFMPRASFEELHRKNMTKQRGTRSKRPNSLGLDAVRGENFKPVDWSRLLSFGLEDLERLKRTRRNPKIVVLGHARHGKDTVCEMLRDVYGLSFTSSSMFCAERVVFPELKDSHGYKSVKECFEDRGQNRALWYKLIAEYNADDGSRLGREILQDYDIYCGLRHGGEFRALKESGVVDFTLWVDRSAKENFEDSSSITVHPAMADMIVDNNGTIADLEVSVERAMTAVMALHYEGAPRWK